MECENSNLLVQRHVEQIHLSELDLTLIHRMDLVQQELHVSNLSELDSPLE